MADTRQANPDVQLDVDLMILEYTLYYAIEAHLTALSASADGLDAEPGPGDELFLVFEAFVNIFNQLHPSHSKSARIQFNMDILELLVLLSRRAGVSNLPLPPTVLGRIGTDTTDAVQVRRTWLLARHQQVHRWREQAKSTEFDHADPRSHMVALHDVEEEIYRPWKRPAHRNAAEDLGGARAQSKASAPAEPSLFGLLPRFMEISADVVDMIDQDANELWMDVASQFMFQASIESLRLQQLHADDDGERPEWPQVDECFAWGYVNVDDLDTTGDDDVAMTGDEGDDGDELFTRIFSEDTQNGQATTRVERAAWTQMRHDLLSEFSIADDASSASQACRLDRLVYKYPLAHFYKVLATCLRDMWLNGCDETVYGTPVLVQIDQGHLRDLGLEGRDFDDFMVRVGLQKDVYGILKLAL